MKNQKLSNIIFIVLLCLLITVGAYYIYSEAEYKKNQRRFILEKDSLRTLEFNNKLKKLDSLDNKLLKQDSLLFVETNVLKKNYKKRKESIDNNRNTLPTLPNF